MIPADLAPYRVPRTSRLARPPLRALIRLIYRAGMRLEISGLENIPAAGAYLVAVNHVSIYDPPLTLSFWPRAIEAIGASYLWDQRGSGWAMRLYHGIPVERDRYDRRVIERTLAALRSGRPVMLAPEGRRTHVPGLVRAEAGVAWFADRVNVPVIPVGIAGTTPDVISRALRGERPALCMRVGAPIHLPPLPRGPERRAARRANTELVMARIAALLPPEYRGIYARLVETGQ